MYPLYPLLVIDGTPLPIDDDSPEWVRVELDPDGVAADHQCRDCGEPLAPTVDGWANMEDATECPAAGDGDFAPHTAVPVPLAWCNSAAVQLDADADEVTVSISVADPRGAFRFTIRRVPDDAPSPLAGCLLLHMPYPGQPMQHAPLTPLDPETGTFIVGAVPAALEERRPRRATA